MMVNKKATATRRGTYPVGDHPFLRPDVFQPYVEQLADLLAESAAGRVYEKQAELAAALDGQPGRELRKRYKADSLRSTGTYFTGSRLANRLASSLSEKARDAEQIVDPACGAGDLLVACARHLPLKSDLKTTLVDWGKRLVGFDTNPAFIEATRYRLVLLAMHRSAVGTEQLSDKLAVAELFPLVQLRSGLEEWKLRVVPSVIIVNPPFSYGVTPEGCTWTNGRVSQAALFMDTCLKNGSEGTRVLAILPDVLRTGARYKRWRQMVGENAKIRSVEIVGQFDEQTDISVFLLDLEMNKAERDQHITWACPLQSGGRTLKDVFDVRVGPVVPFRLDGNGRWFPYAHSEELPPWDTVKSLKYIRFGGTTYKPPFVAIRRTSKADYQIRCIGTLVTGRKAVAVENHLLIALPRDKKVGTCKKLLELLKKESVSSWMNERIRCRHLTVGSVEDLPWPETE